MPESLKAPFLVLHFFYYTLISFLMMLSVILLSVLTILLSALLKLELTSELESDLGDTVDWGRKWPVEFNAGKTQLVLFDRSSNTVLLTWKRMGLFLRKKYLLRCWGWISLLNWTGALTLFLLLKPPPMKLEPWFALWIFTLLSLLYVSINLPYGLAWNTCHVWTGAPSCYLE